MGRSPLRRMAGLSRLGRLLSRVAARTVVGPVADRPPRCVGRKGEMGPVQRCARVAGRLGTREGQMVGLDYRSGPPQVKCPRHVASTHQRPKSNNIIPLTPQAFNHPHRPPFCYCEAAPKRPENPNSPRCARGSAKAHILPSRLCVASHSAIKEAIKEPTVRDWRIVPRQ